MTDYTSTDAQTADWSGVSQVFARILGTVNYGLNRAIDREFPQPWTVNDPAAYQYTVGPAGNYSIRGQSAATPGDMLPINSMLALFALAAVAGITYFIVRG